MARANLRGLIGNLGDTETTNRPPTADAPQHHEGAAGEPSAPLQPRSRPTETAGKVPRRSLPLEPARDEATVLEVVLFSDLQRKETRLRVDQQDALTEQARRLNRAKGAGGQRITDNTLIRVAIDLLLSKVDRLAGRDEDELRRSVGVQGAGR